MREIHIPPSGPPQGPLPSPEIYAAMGEDNIFALARDFYAELGKSPIRDKFPDDLGEASKKLAMFLVPALGGPPLYQAAFGPPRMRARHLPFVITKADQKVWLSCFFKVLEQAPERYAFPKEHLGAFKEYLAGFSAWMVNAPS